MDDVELDWGDDDQPVEHVDNAPLGTKSDEHDDRDDVVSLDGDDDDMQAYLAQHSVSRPTKPPLSPPPIKKSPPPRPPSNSVSAISKSPPAGLPPKPIICDPIKPPYISSSDPALTSASAMAPPPKSTTNGLPPDWETRRSRDGEVYYYNIKTHDSTWTKPAGPSSSPKNVKASHSSRPVLSAPLSASLPPRPMTYLPENERRPPSRERDRGNDHHRDKLSSNDKGMGRRPVSPRPTRGIDSYRPEYPSPPERSRRPPSPPTAKQHGRDRDTDYDPSNHPGRDRAYASLPSPPPRSRRISSPPPPIVGSSTYRHTSPPLPQLSRKASRRSRSPVLTGTNNRSKRSVSPPPFEDRPSRYEADRSGLTRGRQNNNDRAHSVTPPPLVPQKRHETEPASDYPEQRRTNYAPRSNHPEKIEHGTKRRRTNDTDTAIDKRSLAVDRDRNPSRSAEDIVMKDAVDRIRPRGPPLPSQDDRFRMSRTGLPTSSSVQAQTTPSVRPAIVINTAPLPPSGPRSSRPVSGDAVRSGITSISGFNNSALSPPSGPRHQQRDASHPDFANHSKPPPAGPAAGTTRRYGPRLVSAANSTPLGGSHDGNNEDIPRGPRAMAQVKPRDDRNGMNTARQDRSPRTRTTHESRDTRQRNREPETAPRRATSDNRGRSNGPTSGTNAAPIGEAKLRIWGQPHPNAEANTDIEYRRNEGLDDPLRLRDISTSASPREPEGHWRQQSPSPPPRQDVTSSRSPIAITYSRDRLLDTYDVSHPRNLDRQPSRHEIIDDKDGEPPRSYSPPPLQFPKPRRKPSYSPPPSGVRISARDYSPLPISGVSRHERRDSRMDDIIPNARKLSINDDDNFDRNNGRGTMVDTSRFKHDYHLDSHQWQPLPPTTAYTYPEGLSTLSGDWPPSPREERFLQERYPRSPDPYLTAYKPPSLRDEHDFHPSSTAYRAASSDLHSRRRSNDLSSSYEQMERDRRLEPALANNQADSHYTPADFRPRSLISGQSPPPASLRSERRHSFTSQGPPLSLADDDVPSSSHMEYFVQAIHLTSGLAGLPPRPAGPLPPLSAGRSLLDRIEPSRLGGERRSDLHGESSSSKPSVITPVRSNGPGGVQHTSLRERLQSSPNNAPYREGSIPDEESRRRKRRRGGKAM